MLKAVRLKVIRDAFNSISVFLYSRVDALFHEFHLPN